MKIGILADAHGNLEGFQLAMAILERLGAEQMWFLGDAVGYLPGARVVRALMERQILSIQGNHEEMMLAESIQQDRDAIYRLGETAIELDRELREFIKSWPKEQNLSAPCGPIWLMHGSPKQLTRGYVYPDSDLGQFNVPAGYTVFMANTHRPFIRECGDVVFVNVGSCGLPRDAGSLGAACLFDNNTREVRIIRFDITNAATAAMAVCASVHPDVSAVFRRPTPPDVIGEYHDL